MRSTKLKTCTKNISLNCTHQTVFVQAWWECSSFQ